MLSNGMEQLYLGVPADFTGILPLPAGMTFPNYWLLGGTFGRDSNCKYTGKKFPPQNPISNVPGGGGLMVNGTSL